MRNLLKRAAIAVAVAAMGLALPGADGGQTYQPLNGWGSMGPSPAPTWSTGVVGDGSTPSGGTPPIVAAGLAPEIPSNVDVSVGVVNGGQYKPFDQAAELKFRIVCFPSHSSTEDFVLAKGNPNFVHGHSWDGNTLANKDTDIVSLRTTGTSTCPGQVANRTAYYEPDVVKDVNGQRVGIKPLRTAFYYQADKSMKGKLTMPPPGLIIISGVNSMDPTDSARKAEAAAAGVAYSFNGFNGWQCYDPTGSVHRPIANGAEFADGFITADGKDPWGGTCKAGDILLSQIVSPTWWNGRNLSSPNGRDHLRYPVGVNGEAKGPDGWFELPMLTAKRQYRLAKDAEYFFDGWYLSSDRMPGMAQQRPGTTMHADWANGWDQTIFHTAMQFCMGIDGGPGAECNDGTFSATQMLVPAIPDPRATHSRYWPVRTAAKANVTVHGH